MQRLGSPVCYAPRTLKLQPIFPLGSYLTGEGDAQQEASHSHAQGHIGLFLQDPLIPHLIHNGCDQRLQETELQDTAIRAGA